MGKERTSDEATAHLHTPDLFAQPAHNRGTQTHAHMNEHVAVVQATPMRPPCKFNKGIPGPLRLNSKHACPLHAM